MNILLANISQHSGVDSISLLITILTVMVFLFSFVINRISLLRIQKNSRRVKDLSTIMQRTLSTNNL